MNPFKRFKCFRRLCFDIIVVFFLVLPPASLESANTLKVGVSTNSPIISYIDKKETIPKGFSADLAKLLAESMEAEIEICGMTDSNLIKALYNGDVDFIIGFSDDSYNGTNYIKTSVQAPRCYFINSQFYPSFKKNNILNYIVAVEKDRTLSWHTPPKEELNYIQTDTKEESLALVDSGKAQIYISEDSASILSIINDAGYENIMQVGAPIEIVHLVIAVDKNNTDLFNSLSAAYNKIFDDERYLRIVNQLIGTDIKGMIFRYKKYFIVAALLILFYTIVFILHNYVLKKIVVKTKQELKLSEQKYKELIESSPEMIHLISKNGKIELFNKIAQKKLEYGKNDLLSIKMQDLVHPDQKNEMKKFIGLIFKDKYATKEFALFSNTGKEINVEILGSIVPWNDRTKSLACCFSRDLSLRKHLEAELVRSDRLAVIGRLAAGIAHEINNPLSIILSNIDEMVNYELNDEESHESLKSIERNALRASRIIEDLLTFAKPSLLKLRTVELCYLIDNALLFLKQRLEKKDISIEKYCPDDLFLSCNENLIQQMLINLILNSIQAIKEEGKITISVNCIDNRVIIEISDNGIGICDDDFNKIFDPFFTSQKKEGFGLGLFLSKIIVDKHGGSISTRSMIGKGTMMKVELPVSVKTSQ